MMPGTNRVTSARRGIGALFGFAILFAASAQVPCAAEPDEGNSNIVTVPIREFGEPLERASVFARVRLIRWPQLEIFSQSTGADGRAKFAFAPAVEGKYLYLEVGVPMKRVLTLAEPLAGVEAPFLADWRGTDFADTWIAGSARYCADMDAAEGGTQGRAEEPYILHCIVFTDDDAHTGTYTLVSKSQNAELKSLDVLLHPARIRMVEVEMALPYLMAYLRELTEESIIVEFYSGGLTKGDTEEDFAQKDNLVGTMEYPIAELPGGLDMMGLQLWFVQQPGGTVAYRVMAPFDDWVSLGANNTSVQTSLKFDLEFE
jgi:hypothetical protein